MSPTIATKNSYNYRVLLFLVTYSTATALLLLSPKSDAYEWALEPSLRTDLIFTDNLNLVSDKSPVKKESEFIVRLTPGVFSNFTSRRFDSKVDLSIRNLIFANNSDRNRTFIRLRTRNTGTIIENLFYVDANARIRQQNRSLAGRQGDDVNLTNNLQQIQMYSISPYILKRFGNFATSEIRYTRVLTNSDASNVFFNSNTNAYQASLESGSDFRTLEWGLNYSRQDIDFDKRPRTVKLETEIANIQYNFTRRFGLTGTGGYEENTFGVGPDRPKGVRWSVGFVWLPTPRTGIEASGGQRFFGDTYYYDVTHRMRKMAFQSSYKETVRSSRNQFLLEGTGDTNTLLTALLTSQSPPGTSPADIALAAQQLISSLGIPPNFFFGQDFLTNRFFLSKRFVASAGFQASKKSTFLFSVFHITRKPLEFSAGPLDSILGGGTSINQKLEGGTAAWNWKVAPRTSVNLALRYIRIDFRDLFRKDEIKTLNFTVVKEFSEHVAGMLRYRRRERTSDATLGAHTENRFMASLRLGF